MIVKYTKFITSDVIKKESTGWSTIWDGIRLWYTDRVRFSANIGIENIEFVFYEDTVSMKAKFAYPNTEDVPKNQLIYYKLFSSC